MLLVIHNLPSNTRYTDVKALIKDKCGLTELIVDNLVAEGKSKKVTVGLADEGDAALLLRNLNGMYVGNQQVFVEDARQKKTTSQQYQPPTMPNMPNQYNQGQYQYPQMQYDMQYYGQQNENQFGMLQPPPPNFGVPYYMAAQNSNIGNNQQGMVQYPVHQGSTSNDPYQRRGNGFEQEYQGRNREESRPETQSHDRGTRRDRSPRERTSRWNDSDRKRPEERRGRDRSPHRDYDRYETDQSYKSNRSQESYQSRPNQSFGSQQSDRFDKPSDRSGADWEQDRYDSRYESRNEPSGSFRSGDHRKADMPQRFGEDQYSRSRDSDRNRQDNVSKNKRAFDMSDKNKYGPQNKKFGTDQQYNAKKYPGSSGGQFNSKYKLINVQNKKIDNRPQMQPNIPQVQSNRPQGQPNRPQIQPNRPQMQPTRPQVQQNWPRMQANRPESQHNKPFAQPNKPNFNPRPTLSQNRPDNPKIKAYNPPTPARQEGWRVQASTLIANEILKNVGKPCIKRDPVVVQLKVCVRSRLDVILGDDIKVGLKQMLLKYRAKHDVNDDQVFYKGVAAKVDKAQQENKAEQKEGVKKEGDKPKSEIKPKVETKVNPAQAPPAVAEIPEIPQFSSPIQRLPKYPKSSKKLANQLKKAHKQEFIEASTYNLGPVREKVLKEEMDKLFNAYKQSLPNPADPVHKSMCNFLSTAAMDDMRMLLTLHVKKRVMNIRTNLSVRVYCQPKPPKRDAIDEYLKKFGVISIKKSATKKNLFIATCDTYENFDALCKQGSTVIDTLTLTFKPLQIVGPPKNFAKLKKTMAKARGNSGYTLEHGFDENIGDDVNFEGDEQNDDVEFVDDEAFDDNDEEHDEGQKCDELNTSDVILLEDNDHDKSIDTIVIDEIDDKITIVDSEMVVDDVTVDNKDETVKDHVGVVNKDETVKDQVGVDNKDGEVVADVAVDNKEGETVKDIAVDNREDEAVKDHVAVDNKNQKFAVDDTDKAVPDTGVDENNTNDNAKDTATPISETISEANKDENKNPESEDLIGDTANIVDDDLEDF